VKRFGSAVLGLLLAALAISVFISLFIVPGTNIAGVGPVIGAIIVGGLLIVVVAFWWFQRR
jgi:hypothetical protein